MVERKIIQRTLKNPIQKANIHYNTIKNNMKYYSIFNKNMNKGNIKINTTFANQKQLNRKSVKHLKKNVNIIPSAKGVAVEQTLNTPPFTEEIKVNKTLKRTKNQYVNPITGGYTRKVKVGGLPKYRRVYKKITY